MAMVEGLRHEQLMHWKQRWNSRRICSWRKTKRFNHVLMVSCHNPRDPDAVHAIPDLRFKVGTTHHFNHETWPVRNRQIFYKVQICPDSGSLFAFRVEWSNPQFRPVKLKGTRWHHLGPSWGHSAPSMVKGKDVHQTACDRLTVRLCWTWSIEPGHKKQVFGTSYRRPLFYISKKEALPGNGPPPRISILCAFTQCQHQRSHFEGN
jgi:hypothetical protein